MCGRRFRPRARSEISEAARMRRLASQGRYKVRRKAVEGRQDAASEQPKISLLAPILSLLSYFAA